MEGRSFGNQAFCRERDLPDLGRSSLGNQALWRGSDVTDFGNSSVMQGKSFGNSSVIGGEIKRFWLGIQPLWMGRALEMKHSEGGRCT